MPDFDRALSDVQGELIDAGLHEVIDRVEVTESWSIADHATLAFGLFHPGNRRSHIIGTIDIPAMNLSAINCLVSCSRWFGSDDYGRTSLRFVLRHEYAHAIAHLLGLLDKTGLPWGRGTCFTAYAQTNADEDMAETIALFLTRHGRPPCRNLDMWQTAKWRAAAQLLHSVRSRRSAA